MKYKEKLWDNEPLENPVLNWIKNDPKKHKYFLDGSEFLVATKVINNVSKKTRWEISAIEAHADWEDEVYFSYVNGGEVWDSWDWDDVEWFVVLEGECPTPKETS